MDALLVRTGTSDEVGGALVALICLTPISRGKPEPRNSEGIYGDPSCPGAEVGGSLCSRESIEMRLGDRCAVCSMRAPERAPQQFGMRALPGQATLKFSETEWTWGAFHGR